MAKLWLPTLRHGSELFRRVCSIHANMCELASRRVITWHLEECSWAEGYGCAMLGALKRWHEARGVRVRVEWMHRNVRQALQRNGSLPVEFEHEPLQDSFGTTIPYARFELADHHGFDGYVRQHFSAGSQMLPDCRSCRELPRELV